MSVRIKFMVIVFLCLAHLLDANPRPLREGKQRNFDLTGIGDLSSKDILRLVDNTSPDTDNDVINAGQIDDPYENNIEAETKEFSKTVPIGDRPDLASPRDQEQRFVNLLKKQYKGTFPEYGKETKSDFSKNQELDDNLSVQPETVYIGHSDRYKGKDDGFDGIPDETSDEQDNLDTFDADAKVLNDESMKLASTTTTSNANAKSFDADDFQDALTSTTERPSRAHARQNTMQTLEDILGTYDDSYGDNTDDDGQTGIENPVPSADYEGHKSVSGNDEGIDDDQATKKPESTEDMTDPMDDQGTGNAEDHMDDHVNDHVTDHDDMDDNMADGTDNNEKEELKRLQEKNQEEAMWDSEEKLRQKLARKKKQKHLTKGKEESKEKHLSKGILKEFDELKGKSSKTSEKVNDDIHDEGKTNENNLKLRKQSKHIKYVHADESQVTGDAILDFLDKLLEKDPKELKHDVMAMTKEMQKEGKTDSDAPVKSATLKDKATSNSDSSESQKDKPEVTSEPEKTSQKPDDVDNWIEQLEDNIDVEKQNEEEEKESGTKETNEVKEQSDSNEQDGASNENYYDEEYDQFHDESQDIYPEQYDGQSLGAEVQEDHRKEKEKKKMEKKQDDFDYEEFKEEAVKMHNEFRRRHNAEALTWSDSLAKKAKNVASKLLHATRRSFKREIEKQGENIAILPYTTRNIAKQAVEKWYGEITKFSFTSPSIKPETKDFTQIIWKNSKKVGMGFVSTTNKKKTLVVALYSPTGNAQDKMRENLITVKDDPYADIKRHVLTRNRKKL
ncbi:DNA ligase 1-like [Dendronephthya gigantea]|uniref:DNA ligase 1-like n=1 Tax=Dendronephthya gigantea TaxID=151771 RepID=UPI00106A9368|nr:DNA ligase 1-like [Dendronephthya gigantea]